MNKFQTDEPEPVKPFRIAPELEPRQVARVREVRASRSAHDCCSALSQLENAARGTENLMPHILECCRKLATVGEISDALRKIFGEYRESF